jgi:CRP-like cAMP-binding protein
MLSPAPAQNRLLEELPGNMPTSVRTECELVELTSGDVLSEPGDRIRDVYFPTESFVSLVAQAQGGASLEVALVGDEGMVGIPVMLGTDTKPLRVLVQRSGKAWRMKAETFKYMTDTDALLRREFHKYIFSRLSQVAQNAVCANAHRIEARLARRLLMMQDRSHSDPFQATQKSLASMLGVRRSTVTCAAIALQRTNLIQYHRGTLTVLDRKGLERISCECYRAEVPFRRSANTG